MTTENLYDELIVILQEFKKIDAQITTPKDKKSFDSQIANLQKQYHELYKSPNLIRFENALYYREQRKSKKQQCPLCDCEVSDMKTHERSQKHMNKLN